MEDTVEMLVVVIITDPLPIFIHDDISTDTKIRVAA